MHRLPRNGRHRLRLRRHAERRRIDDESRLSDSFLERRLVPVESADLAVLRELLSQETRLRGISHAERDLSRARAQQTVEHRACRAARAQEHDTLSLDGKTACRKRTEETLHIGVKALETACLAHDRIDRPDGTRRFIHLIQQRQDRRLVRNRHIEAAKPQRTKAAHAVFQPLGQDGQGDIGIVQSRRPNRRILHRWRKRMLDRRADDGKIFCLPCKHHCILLYCSKQHFLPQ